VGLARRERVDDLRDLYGAAFVWAESPAEMRSRMTAAQRERFDRLLSQQAFLLDLLIERGGPTPRLDPALADASLDSRVAAALAVRTLMRRALRGT
jgi:hypothetical protein